MGRKIRPQKIPVAITGQVVDYECCVKGGLSISILTRDKKLYVAVGSKMMDKS